MNPIAKWTMIAGGALTLGGPILGLLGTVFGMMFSFKTLGISGVQNPESLSSNISTVLVSTACGIILGGLGIFILIAGSSIWLLTRRQAKPIETLKTEPCGPLYPLPPPASGDR